MKNALRVGIGVVVSCFGGVYGAIVGACVTLWLLETISEFLQSEAFGVTAFVFLVVLIRLGGLVGLVVGALASWITFARLSTRTAPARASRRRTAFRQLSIAVGASAFFVLNKVIDSSLAIVWPERYRHLVAISGEPIPLVVRVPVTIATLVVSIAVAVCMVVIGAMVSCTRPEYECRRAHSSTDLTG